ncbi:MAG: hypothetical protein EOP04_08105 [Proteobacteria bacterium]|nr:MAG: hypothetical protein EOP04_08105 [Pseudomonadota bacterium]
MHHSLGLDLYLVTSSGMLSCLSLKVLDVLSTASDVHHQLIVLDDGLRDIFNIMFGLVMCTIRILQDKEEFAGVNTKSVYITKKNLRRIIRIANQFMKYSDDPETPVQILLFICVEINKLPVNFSRSTSLSNILSATRNRLLKQIESLHEDLQYEYKREFQKLNE